MIANSFKRPVTLGSLSLGLFAFALAVAPASTVQAQTQAPAATQGQAKPYSPEQQRLCQDDAMRLCSADVPDVDKVTACMRKQKASLSEACKAVFDK
jgi:hypothetical protein